LDTRNNSGKHAGFKKQDNENTSIQWEKSMNRLKIWGLNPIGGKPRKVLSMIPISSFAKEKLKEGDGWIMGHLRIRWISTF